MRRVALVIVFIFLLISNVIGFRVSRPPTLSKPLTIDQINQLNDYLESLWNLQNGEFNLDIVTSTKNGAGAGDYWFVITGSVVRMQYKANNHIFTITPDGF